MAGNMPMLRPPVSGNRIAPPGNKGGGLGPKMGRGLRKIARKGIRPVASRMSSRS